MKTYVVYQKSPIGRIRLRASDDGLLAVDHVNQQAFQDSSWLEGKGHPILNSAIEELVAYFEGEHESFQTSLAPEGTDFQQQVWAVLRTIPYGETATCSDVAYLIVNPKAVRAVGAANGRNPLSIFIPCHRVIGKNGKLVGYAGGMEAKQILLSIERSKFKLS